MLTYCQRDPRWATHEIGLSGLTIGRYGCTITCVAMLASYFGQILTPSAVENLLKFTPQGLIIWKSADFSKFRFENREHCQDNYNISAALKDPKRAVILEVSHHSHWVVATGWQEEGYCYKIADPWFGDHSNMVRYGNNITGAAYFVKK
jgi:ABC-type bacteriocin/lantibiotic exporter with double-glycine peptidase domain